MIVAVLVLKVLHLSKTLGIIRVPKFMLEGFYPVFRHLGFALLTSSFKGKIWKKLD